MVIPVSREFYQEAGRQQLIGTDVELIQGLIIKKMSKSPYHIFLVRRLIEIFEKALFPRKENFFITKEDPIGTLDSEPEPDIAIIAGQPRDFLDKLPSSAELVVEVAVSTLKKDQLKAEVYALAGVKEYWIVDVNGKQLEKFILPDHKIGAYKLREIVDCNQTWISSSFPEIEIKPAEFFKAD